MSAREKQMLLNALLNDDFFGVATISQHLIKTYGSKEAHFILIDVMDTFHLIKGSEGREAK